MPDTDGRRTSVAHWDRLWKSPVSARLPSPLHVTNRNIQRLLRPSIRPGSRVLEIGCSPGKTLAWAASRGAQVSGLDISSEGVARCRQLFEALSLKGEFRCEDLLGTTYCPGDFDVVYSLGLIEHFDDPRPIVEAHVSLARPGGTVIMAIPNFGGFQGRLMKHLAPDAAALHNLSIMTPRALLRLAAPPFVKARTFRSGRFALWHCGLERIYPRVLGQALLLAANGVGLLQPLDVGFLCPLLALEISVERT